MSAARYNWAAMPEWAQFVVTDEDGTMWAFEQRPRANAHVNSWINQGGGGRLEFVGYADADKVPDWRKTLERRPQ